jgi:hypothetical protein
MRRASCRSSTVCIGPRSSEIFRRFFITTSIHRGSWRARPLFAAHCRDLTLERLNLFGQLVGAGFLFFVDLRIVIEGDNDLMALVIHIRTPRFQLLFTKLNPSALEVSFEIVGGTSCIRGWPATGGCSVVAVEAHHLFTQLYSIVNQEQFTQAKNDMSAQGTAMAAIGHMLLVPTARKFTLSNAGRKPVSDSERYGRRKASTDTPYVGAPTT